MSKKQIDKDADSSRAPAVNRAIFILNLLVGSPEPLSASAIAIQVGIVPSACQSILQILESEEFIARDPKTLRYSISVGLIAVTSRLLNNGVPLQAIQEELDLISSSFNITSVANEVDRRGSTVIALSFGGGVFGTRLIIGRHVPAFVGASGRCYAAWAGLGAHELRKEFRGICFDQPVTLDEWLKQVDEAHTTGVGWDEGQYIKGYTTIAVPVFEGQFMRRSVAAIFASGQLTASEGRQLAEYLKGVGIRLST